MRLLCKYCTGLAINEATVTEIRGRLQKWQEQGEMAEFGFGLGLLHPSVEELRISAEGGLIGKSCHLCALILRSLKRHGSIGTPSEYSEIPNGPVAIMLKVSIGSAQLVANIGSVHSAPLVLSLEDGDCHCHLAMLCWHTDICRCCFPRAGSEYDIKFG
jgi:hypothetical protein